MDEKNQTLSDAKETIKTLCENGLLVKNEEEIQVLKLWRMVSEKNKSYMLGMLNGITSKV